jgi:hypothetical protein
MPDFTSGVLLGRPKHVRRFSLAQLEAWAVGVEQAAARVSKAGVAVAKRKAGPGHPTLWLIVITEAVWRRLTRAAEPEPLPAATLARGSDGTLASIRLPVGRPTPAVVKKTVRALQQTNETVLVAMLVRALHHETGCSRAGAYRAIKDAFAAGVIRC